MAGSQSLSQWYWPLSAGAKRAFGSPPWVYLTLAPAAHLALG